MATGDRPNFPLANQRLDKVDIEAISDLVGENIMRTVGGLLGPCAGLLSDVTVTYDSGLQTITVGACRLGYANAAPDSSVAIDGGVVRWDPAIDPTGGTVSVALFGTTAGDDGYVFFKREEIASDEENRAYYDALAQEKKVGVANTRIRETISLGTALTYDGLSRDDGWFPFLYLKWTITGGEPSVYKISAFDGFGGGVDNAGVARAFGGDVGLGVDWDEGYVGVSRLFREVIGSLQHAYDNDFTLNNLGSVTSTISEQAYRWTGYGLVRGLKQLHADLSTAESTVSTLNSSLSSLQTAVSNLQSNFVYLSTVTNRTPVMYTQVVNASNTILVQNSYTNLLPTGTNARVSTGVWQINFGDGSFGCSETLNPCTPIVSVNNDVDGQVYWLWLSEYVLQIVTRRFNAGSFSNYNLGFSLIIVKGVY
jgi:hypothetical protein